MKSYHIYRDARGVHCQVKRTTLWRRSLTRLFGEAPGARDEAYDLIHVVIHSPDGFECGYGGSGPSDLALSILTDYFDARPSLIQRVWLGKVGDLPEAEYALATHILRAYQQFKVDFIAPTILGPGEERVIRDLDICDWQASFWKQRQEQERRSI